MRAEQRLDYVDAFRGLGIIAMVMGHIGFGEIFDHFIHAFHMPMFFFISGFFYRTGKYGTKEYVDRKVKSLLIPYVSFGFFHYFLVVTIVGFSINPVLHLLTVNTEGLPIAGALWFLTALFLTDIIYFLFDKWNVKWLIIPAVLIGSFADQILPYPLPWALSAACVGLGLYWMGQISKKYENKLTKIYNMNLVQILIVGIVTTGLIFVNGYVNMREGRYGFLPLFWINVLLSICLGISISKLICKTDKFKWLMGIGKNSIVYLCLNQVVIQVLHRAFSCVAMPKIVSNLLVLILSLAVLWFLSMLFTKTKLKIFIGK